MSCASPEVDSVEPPLNPAAEYRRQSWSRKDGLPDNTVTAILQTRDGALWIGTRLGVARFDGLRFTSFNRFNTPAFRSDLCTGLAEDSSGALWIGTDDGLVRRQARQFTSFTTTNGLDHNMVVALSSSRSGGVWIVTATGLMRYRDGRFTRIDAGASAQGNRAHSAFEDAAGNLWVGTDHNLERHDAKTGKLIEIVPLPADDSDSEPSPVLHITSDGQGNLWASRGSTVLRIKNGTAMIHRQLPLDPEARIAFVAADRASRLWIGIEPNGIYRDPIPEVNVSFTEMEVFNTFFSAKNGLTSEDVTAFHEDQQGNIWIGTRSSGLNCWRPNRFLAFTRNDGLADDRVWALCVSRDDSLWIGTDTGLCQLRDKKIATFPQLEPRRNIVRALIEDKTGNLWLGTLGGLGVLSQHVLTDFRLPGELGGNKVRVVFQDRAGGLWVGREAGLARQCGREWITYSTADGLAHNDVRVILEDRAGNLWLGTFGGGLMRVPNSGATPNSGSTSSTSEGSESSNRSDCDPENPSTPGATPGSIERDSFTKALRSGTTFTTRDGLSSDRVWALFEDAASVLWIGTERGLNRIENGRIHAFSIEDGLFEDTANSIVEDRFGYLWIGGTQGIYRVRKTELNEVAAGRQQKARCLRYDEDDGLPTPDSSGQVSQPAACLASDGRIWFATAQGLVVVNPKELQDDSAVNSVGINEVRVDGNIVLSDGIFAPLIPAAPESVSAGALSVIRIPPGRRRTLDIAYTANCFAAPERVRFRYRLEGYRTAWTVAGTRRSAHFTDLRPGRYRFEVTASDKQGRWTGQSAVVGFKVAPHFYETKPFYALAGAAFLGLTIGSFRWHRRRTINQERTRLTLDTHDGVGGGVSKLATAVSELQAHHDDPVGLQKGLEKIVEIARDLDQSAKDIIWAADPGCDSLESLIGHVHDYTGKVCSEFSIDCRFHAPPELLEVQLDRSARRDLFFAIKEALNNILKHAEASEVCIRWATQESILSLEIADNGKGFCVDAPQGSGRGLGNIRERISRIGGQAEFISAPGRGTRLRITLTLPRPRRRRGPWWKLLPVVVMSVAGSVAGQAAVTGSFLGASAPEQIPLGQNLRVTVTVENTGTEFWDGEMGDLAPAWAVQVRNPTWPVSWVALTEYIQESADVGATARHQFTLPSQHLPRQPGTYSVEILALYPTAINPARTFAPMHNSPKRVSFSIGNSGPANTAGTTESDTDQERRAEMPLVPPPQVTSIHPRIGAPGTVVIITGRGFDENPSNNIVHFGAVRAPVTAATPTTLSAVVPAGSTYAPVTVTSHGLTAFSSMFFVPTFQGDGETPFQGQSPIPLPLSLAPIAVILADLDLNGKSEVVVVPDASSRVISVFLNRADGPLTSESFASPRRFRTGKGPPVLVSDINGDGRLDLVALQNRGVLSIRLNQSAPGSLEFSPRFDLGGFPANAGLFSLEDLDQDGRPDVLASMAEMDGEATFINRNTSTGNGLSFGPPIAIIAGAPVQANAIADLDGDSKPDLVRTLEDAAVSLYRNISRPGHIAFAPSIDIGRNETRSGIAIGDLDGDEKPDLIVANVGFNARGATISVFRNTSQPGALAFEPAQDFPVLTGPTQVVLSDLDGDRKLDVVVGHDVSKTVCYLQNISLKGRITLAPRIDFAPDQQTPPRALAAGDLDGDSRPDLICGGTESSHLTILPNSSSTASP